MKQKQILTLAILSLLTLLGYVYIFGDSGLIIQARLEKSLANMEIQVKELEKENKTLNQKVISDSSDSRLMMENNAPSAQSVILKFENNMNESTEDELKKEIEPDLFELRSLYIVTMLFITLVAVTLSVYLSGVRQSAEYIEDRSKITIS